MGLTPLLFMLWRLNRNRILPQKNMRVKKGKFKREIKAFRTQKIMNSLVLLLLSNKEAFPCFFFCLFPLFFLFFFTTYIKS